MRADSSPAPPNSRSTASTASETQNSSSMKAYRCSAKATWIANGRRLRREEEDVGDQQQLERPEIGLALTARMRLGQRARAAEQQTQAAQQAAVDAADGLQHLGRDALQG